MEPSVFLDFQLPNAATWFYFALFLTVALFFQFTRPLSIRNLDLLMLFLLVPGFLLLQEAAGLADRADVAGGEEQAKLVGRAHRERVLGYVWLLAGSAYWFARAVFDLILVRRPTVSANLNIQGLSWFGLALYVGLTAVAFRPSEQREPEQGKKPAPIEQVQDTATAVVRTAQTTNGTDAPPATTRFWAIRGLAVLCHTAVLVGLVMIGWRHFNDITAGVGSAALYTLLPYTAYHIGQVHHVWPTAFLVWAVFCYRRPTLAGWLLGLAAGTSVFPALLFPLWFGFYSGRGASRFGLAFLGATAVSVGITAAVLWTGPTGVNLVQALHLTDWKAWTAPTSESIWNGSHWAYRLPVFVLFVGFLAGVTLWPNPKNLSHLLAQSAAVLVAIQFWHGDRGGVYVLWYLPLLLLMVFRPNLSTAEPPPIADNSVFVRIAGAAWRRVRPAPTNPNSKPLAV